MSQQIAETAQTDLPTNVYIRVPLFVRAIRVTSETFQECATWCGGEIQMNNPNEQMLDGTVDPARQYIAVPVTRPLNQRQTKALVGDWILQDRNGKFKVYTDKAFQQNFISPEGVVAADVEWGLTSDEDRIKMIKVGMDSGKAVLN